MWMVLATALGIAVIVAAALLYGDSRWRSATETIHTRLEAARLASQRGAHKRAELEGLAAPVQRYFRAAFTDGQSLVSAVGSGTNESFGKRTFNVEVEHRH